MTETDNTGYCEFCHINPQYDGMPHLPGCENAPDDIVVDVRQHIRAANPMIRAKHLTATEHRIVDWLEKLFPE